MSTSSRVTTKEEPVKDRWLRLGSEKSIEFGVT
jgi:hypothetical protein